MSDLQGGTVKERLARIETILCNHLAHHAKNERWLMAITTAALSGLILMMLPSVVKFVFKLYLLVRG